MRTLGYSPHPADKFGWGLRIRPLSFNKTLLARESIEHARLQFVLINQTKDVQPCFRLEVSSSTGELGIGITRLNGWHVDTIKICNGGIFFEQTKLHAYQSASSVYKLGRFGYYQLAEPGEYELRGSLRTSEGLIVAPDIKLNVIEPTASAILHSQPVPLEGQFAKWPKERQDTAVIQQIKVGNRTWLFYRKYYSPENGGKVSATFRIAELPGKVVDFKVDGAFGDHNPLTINYRETTYTKWTTTHVISSISGRVLTAKEIEKLRQDKLKLEAKPPAEKK